MTTSTKAYHDAIQSEISTFSAQLKDFNDSKPTMIDFLVNKEICKGIHSLERISKNLRIPKQSLISNLSARMFSIFGDTIEN